MVSYGSCMIFLLRNIRRLWVGRERIWFKLAQMTWIPLFWQHIQP